LLESITLLKTRSLAKQSLRHNAIAEYHDLLKADRTLSAARLGKLREAMRADRLLYGDRPICAALRPHLMDAKQFAALTQTAQLIASALEKVATAVCNPLL